MIATFNGAWDWTAVGTLALAIVTGVSLAFGWWSLKQTQRQIELGQEQLEQTQREIELSRREVEEAHRPVLVPLADSRPTEFGHSATGRSTWEAKPRVDRLHALAVPIENIGSGPALRIKATVELLDENGGPSAAGDGGQTPAIVMGLKASGSVVVQIKVRGLARVTGFWLTLTYEDVAGKPWITKARYIASREQYDEQTIDTQAYERS